MEVENGNLNEIAVTYRIIDYYISIGGAVFHRVRLCTSGGYHLAYSKNFAFFLGLVSTQVLEESILLHYSGHVTVYYMDHTISTTNHTHPNYFIIV